MKSDPRIKKMMKSATVSESVSENTKTVKKNTDKFSRIFSQLPLKNHIITRTELDNVVVRVKLAEAEPVTVSENVSVKSSRITIRENYRLLH